MVYPTDPSTATPRQKRMPGLTFNPQEATVMHLDINSCFATIEQQANPLLRGKPLVVAAYASPSGCILAASIEAKQLGIKTGMRVKDGRALYPGLIVLDSDPQKYRAIHLSLRRLLADYSDRVIPQSIDEFVVNMVGYPAYKKGWTKLGGEIKQRIKTEVGDWIRVSIGFGPNQFLAKTASNFRKPDGLFKIDQSNYQQVYRQLNLVDLHGINKRNALRLNSVGIFKVAEFGQAELTMLKAAFQSVGGYYWYVRLRGWEIDSAPLERRSFGNSYSLPKPLVGETELAPILLKLIEKMSARLRRAGFRARGVHLGIEYRDGSFWHQGRLTPAELFAPRDFYRYIGRLLGDCPYHKPVRNLAVSCFELIKAGPTQLLLFENLSKTKRLVKALDRINNIWGEYTLAPARMSWAKKAVPDRISFGGVRELI